MTDPALTEREREEALSDVLTVLADDRRRHVLRYFETTGEKTATIDRLAEYLLDVSDSTADRRLVQIALHHKVLPELEEAWWLTYDERSHTGTHCGRGSRVALHQALTASE